MQAIKGYPVPTSKKELDLFLHLICWVRKFIPNLATHAINLWDMVNAENDFLWDDKAQQKDFDLLKSLIANVNKVLEILDRVHSLGHFKSEKLYQTLKLNYFKISVCRKANLHLRKSKCLFMVDKMRTLGFIVSHWKIEPVCL